MDMEPMDMEGWLYIKLYVYKNTHLSYEGIRYGLAAIRKDVLQIATRPFLQQAVSNFYISVWSFALKSATLPSWLTMSLWFLQATDDF